MCGISVRCWGGERRLALVAAVIIIGGGALACQDEPAGLACTEIGCGDQIAVFLEGDLPASYVVTAVADDGEERNQACTELCGGKVYFHFTPAVVTIRVTWPDGSIQQTVEPAYSFYYPNGERCPPRCKQAVITVTIDSSQGDD